MAWGWGTAGTGVPGPKEGAWKAKSFLVSILGLTLALGTGGGGGNFGGLGGPFVVPPPSPPPYNALKNDGNCACTLLSKINKAVMKNADFFL